MALFDGTPSKAIYEGLLNYWISEKQTWPQLAQMALDLYATPAMSDEPERIFSMTGNLLSPQRRTMKDDDQQMMCLRSWQASCIVQSDQPAFEYAVATATECVIDDDLNNTELTSDNILYHERS